MLLKTTKELRPAVSHEDPIFVIFYFRAVL